MQQDPENSSALGSRLTSYVAVERKKVIVAACLVTIMAIMWVRLLTGKGQPAAASAASAGAALRQLDEKALQVSVVYKEPPFIEGRNDALTGDCFSPGDWRAFLSKDSVGPQELVADYGQQSADQNVRNQMIRKIAEGLKLQIMEMGAEPQAFISDTLVKEGGKLTIAVGEASVEFQVLRITRSMVQLQCEGMQFEIKLNDR